MKVGILIVLTKDPYACIEKASKQGFDNGQISVWDMSLYNDEVVSELKRACADFNFTITAVWCGWSGPCVWKYPKCYVTLGLVPSEYRAMRTRELLCGAEFARKLGVRDIITHIGYLPDNPYHPDNLGVCEALRYICRELKKYGQNFLFETGEELPLTLVMLMNEVGYDNWGINFDPANLIMNGRGSSPVAALKFFLPHIKGFHAKDALAISADNIVKKEVPCGEGATEMPKLVSILKESGYDGSLTIEYEVSATEEERNAQLAKIKAYLEALI